MKTKLHIDWKKALIFLLVSGGLLYITRSFWMTIGIILLLFVIDSLLADYEYRRNTKKIFDQMRQEHENEQHTTDTDSKDQDPHHTD